MRQAENPTGALSKDCSHENHLKESARDVLLRGAGADAVADGSVQKMAAALRGRRQFNENIW